MRTRHALGQFDRAENHALVFLRQERRARTHERLHRQEHRQRQQHSSQQQPRRKKLRTPYEKALEVVDRPVEPRQRPVLVRPRLVEQKRAQRRRERERADRRKTHSRRQRHRELLVDAPRDAAHKADRHEDAQQHERRGDDRAGHVAHRLNSRLLGVEPARLDQKLHALDDDDAVVHHHADGEHEAEQRQDVDRVAHDRHEDEGRAQRNRNRQARNQRRAPVLEEDVAHEHHEGEGDRQGGYDLADTAPDVIGRVVGDGVIHIVGKFRLQALKFGNERIHRGNGVRARLLVDGEHDGRLVVEHTVKGVILFADFGARDVLQLDDAALVVLAHDDFVELRGGLQTPAGKQRIGEHAILLSGRGADRAERSLDILLRDCGDDLLGIDAQCRQSLRIEPDAHREFRPVDGHVAHAGHAKENRLDVAVGVVRERKAVDRPLRRIEREEAQRIGRLGADAAAELLGFRRQFRLGLRQTVLHLDEIHVAVGFDVERNFQLVLAVVRAVARHVEHVVDTVDFVFDRRGDGVHHLLRIGAGVVVGDRYFRRRHLRIL